MERITYNLEYLKSIANGDEDFILDMIQTFITNVPEELTKIKMHIESENWYSAGTEAHKFASNLLYLNIEVLKSVAIQIEESGMGMKNTENIPILYLQLKTGCEEVISQLKNDFNII